MVARLQLLLRNFYVAKIKSVRFCERAFSYLLKLVQ